VAFPSFTEKDVLRVASLDDSAYMVDHLSVHRDIALATVVKLDPSVDEDNQLLVCARCDCGAWRQVETLAGPETMDIQFGGGAPGLEGRELIFTIPDVVTLKTTISPRGNWAFVYSDPLGRRVMGTSVVEGNFRR
jgi:hypothetical protein